MAQTGHGTPCKHCSKTLRYRSGSGNCVTCSIEASKRNSRRRYTEGKRWSKYDAYDRRNRNLKRNYGITIVEYDEMVRLQDGRCAICLTTEPGGSSRRFHVDHDHKTGKLRALLCYLCNVGLGSFRDDPERLERAAEYLRAWNE